MNAEILAVEAVPAALTDSVAIASPADDVWDASNQFLSNELVTYGLQVKHLTMVADDLGSLREALRRALGRSDLVLLVGGLSDGSAHYSREAVSEVMGIPLELHGESLERVQEYFLNTGREMPLDSQRLSMLPRGCTVFPNEHGTVPGFAVSRYEQQVLVLPATPGELLPMFSDYVAPYLSHLVNGTVVSRTVGVFGLSESALTQRLADLMSEANPGVVSYAKDGEAILRITARAADRQAAFALSNTVITEIQKRLGINVYGVDVGSLQKAVVVLLLDKHMKIATAESCTAGLLSGRLTEVSGASSVFECGIAAYSPEIKHNILGVPYDIIEQHGTVSPEVATAMAVGARRVGNAHLGVGITGVAGPDPSEGKPVGTVYIALADEKRVWVKKIAIDILEGDTDRESIRALATSHALDLVRRYLEALPAVMAGGEALLPLPQPPAPVIPRGETKGKKRRYLASLLPWRSETKAVAVMKSVVWLLVLAALALIGLMLYTRVLRPMRNQWMFQDLASMYDSSAPILPASAGVDYPDNMMPSFSALYARNSDVRGWVKISDTNINYPVMASRDSYYRYRNFDRQFSRYGVPYLDESNMLDTYYAVNRSLIINGNNTRDGQMFSDLTNYYNNLSYLKSHPIIEMNTLYKDARWKIMAVLVVSDTAEGRTEFDYRQTVFAGETDFLSFAGKLRVRSLYAIPDGQADVQEGDSLLLLTTNFEDTAKFDGARLVIAARMVRDGEADTADLSSAAYNTLALMPSAWTTASPGEAVTKRTQAAEITTGTTSHTQSTVTDVVTRSTSVSTTNTTRATATTTETIPETEGPTGTEPPATTSTATAATTTPTTAPSNPGGDPDDYTAPPIVAGSVAESQYLSKVTATVDGKVVTLADKSDLQMLLARIVKSEMGSASMTANNLAAQKAQAVASYTYLLYSKSVNYGSLQPITLTNTLDKKIYDAMGEVTGYKILSSGSAICAMYSASTPGFTADNLNASGGKLPYGSVTSVYETASTMAGVSNWKSTYTVSLDSLKQALTDYFGSTVSLDSTTFAVTKYDANGQYAAKTNAYYYKPNATAKTYISGYHLRLAVNKYLPGNLRSYAFTVTSSTEQSVTLAVTGYGHGIGLSQWGAVKYAEHAGWDYVQILSHYYQITDTSSHRLVAPVWP